MFNKKAEIGYREIFAVIFVLVFAILWFAFQELKYKPAQEQFFDAESCRLSVLTASLPTQGVTTLSELNGCKTTERTEDEIDSELVNEKLAKDLDLCWSMFGRGKIAFLKNFGGTKEICFKCAKTTFTSDIDVNKNSFETYLSNSESKLNVKPLILLNDANLKEDDVVYTMIIASKSLGDFSLLETFILGPTGVSNRVISEYFVYATNFNAALALVPREKVKETCETL